MSEDLKSNPEALARANRAERLRHLKSLTLESAARELEAILDFQSELDETRPRRTPRPLPRVSLAILLTGAPHEDDETGNDDEPTESR